jgi:hypothetical protein
MRRIWTVCGFAVLAGAAIALACFHRPAEARAQGGNAIVITLKKEFIDKYEDRVTIEADVHVDAVGPVHPAKNDAEVHIAARAAEVGMPLVAEIMDARNQKAAVKAVRAAEGKDPIKVTGAWRFWCEHAGGGPFKQGPLGKAFAKEPKSNPPHVFEIHPVTRVGELDIEDSVGPIDGFKYKEAHEAFTHYENVACKIKDNGNTVTIRTNMAGYNIPTFLFEPDDGEQVVAKDGGRFVFGAVRDLDGELLVRRIRCAFMKGTEAESVIKNLPASVKRVQLVGMPRISLKLVHARLKMAKEEEWQDAEPLTWNLPYEIIAVAVLRGTDD